MAPVGGKQLMMLAHLGADHLLSSLLYLLPVVIVLLGIAVTSWRDRRADASDRATSTVSEDPELGPAA